MDADDDLTSDEAARLLGVSRQTLYAYVSRGLVASEPSAEAGTRARRYSRRALADLEGRRQRRRDAGDGGSGLPASVLDSAVSLIERGRLWYRGVDACELSRTAAFEEVAWLLWTGATDGAEPFPPSRVGGARASSRGSLLDRLIACLVRERARHPFTLAEPAPETLRAAAATVSALFAAVGASGEGPLPERLARAWEAPSADDLRAALILCADHGFNTSAFTARCVASTDAPVHNALLAALCALEGRRHGGASREVGDLLDEVRRVGAPAACDRMLARRGRLPGFGVPPVYASGDPRAVELLSRLRLPADDPAAQLLAFGERLGVAPSVEVALAALARQAALPPDAAFVVFALGRSIGWVAHALEAAALGTLIRPHARYTGPRPHAAATT